MDRDVYNPSREMYQLFSKEANIQRLVEICFIKTNTTCIFTVWYHHCSSLYHAHTMPHNKININIIYREMKQISKEK